MLGGDTGQGRTKLLMTPALSTIHPDPHLTANSMYAFLLTSFNVSLFEINLNAVQITDAPIPINHNQVNHIRIMDRI